MTTRREIRNAQVDAFFSANIFSLVGPFSLDAEKFKGPFGEVGRNGFELLVEDSDTLEIGSVVRIGETNLRLGRELVGDVVPALPVKATRQAVKRESAALEIAALPSLETLYGEVSDDAETLAKADAERDMMADEIDVDAEFAEILSDYEIAE